MHRSGYANYNDIEPYGTTDHDRMNPTNYYAPTGYVEDHACRPVVVDAEGRKNPNIRYAPTHNSESGYHVVKAETVVERFSTRTPVVGYVVTGYRPYGAATAHHDPEMEDGGYSQPGYRSGSTYDNLAENFFPKILTEVNQQQPTKVSSSGPGPYTANWRARPIPTGQDPHQKKIYSVPVEEKQFMENNPGISPKIYNFSQRPNEQGPVLHPNRQLGKPTTDINSAVEFLTEGVRNIESSNILTRPAMAAPGRGNLGVRWRNDVKSADSDGMDSPRKYYQEAAMNPMKYNDREYQEKGANFPVISQQPRFTVPPPSKEVKSYSQSPPSTIDSSEARKRYGKLKPLPAAAVPENELTGSINSDDLLKKYNGAKVPW